MPTAMDRNSTASGATPISPANRRLLQRQLLAWYRKHARDLSWRRSRDPYRVWVSEIMLQQTQVATVERYFTRFMAAFPNVRRLAAADEVDVLRLWEGLGYYRRARQMHAAARQIVAEHGGNFPDTVETLRTLPGIGRYTAGAIASIAFEVRAPILEANTIRLLSRLVAYRGDPLSTAGQRLLWHVAEEILPNEDVAHFNQALMELGSLVCTPNEPKCPECPLAKLCAANRLGLQESIPPAKRRPQFTEVREAAVIIYKNGRVLMRRCGAHERWAGLWDFPRFAIEAEGPLFARDELAQKVQEQTGVRCEAGPLLKTFKHGVTRYRITLDCYSAAYVAGRVRGANGTLVKWLPRAELAALPLSTTGRKIAKLVADQVGLVRDPRYRGPGDPAGRPISARRLAED